MVEAYKLFRVYKDGSIGPLFINCKQRLPIGEWLFAECHPTKGFAIRPGWHTSKFPNAPHLSTKGRSWFKVLIDDYYEFQRPNNQGGLWYISNKILILDKYDCLSCNIV